MYISTEVRRYKIYFLISYCSNKIRTYIEPYSCNCIVFSWFLRGRQDNYLYENHTLIWGYRYMVSEKSDSYDGTHCRNIYRAPWWKFFGRMVRLCPLSSRSMEKGGPFSLAFWPRRWALSPKRSYREKWYACTRGIYLTSLWDVNPTAIAVYFSMRSCWGRRIWKRDTIFWHSFFLNRSWWTYCFSFSTSPMTWDAGK